MGSTKVDHPLKVALIQQFFPAYRVPVFCKLSDHASVELTLVHGTSPAVHPGEIGLDAACSSMPFRVVRAPIPGLRWRTHELLWFARAIKLVQQEAFDVVIHNFATRWASLGRIRAIQQGKGRAFVLWGIGFSQRPTPILNRLRMGMIGRADATILYSNRDREKYLAMRAPAEKLFVARNSVDLRPIDEAIASWTRERLVEFRRERGLDQGPVLVSVGRLAENKRLDVLLRAGAEVVRDFEGLKIVLIGDGPEKARLRAMTRELGLEPHVTFAGPITEEESVAPWFLSSDAVVAPGQIGLLAVHAAAYGKPLLTSDNPVLHGPEVEVFCPGITGLVYPYEDEKALAAQIKSLLEDPGTRQQYGEAAQEHVRRECGIGNMVNGVLNAVSHVTGRSLPLFEPYP
jgi:glycosyltransferase involved in cell wall biosynthesis